MESITIPEVINHIRDNLFYYPAERIFTHA